MFERKHALSTTCFAPFAILLLIEGIAVAQDSDPTERNAHQEPQGSWYSDDRRWVFDENGITEMMLGDSRQGKETCFRFQVSPAREPAELTLFNRNELRQCIYRLDEESLTVALNLSSPERPVGFEPSDNSSGSLLALKFYRNRAKAMSPSVSFLNRAVAALLKNDSASLRKLAAETQQLPATTRRELPFRIDGDRVEVSIRGEVPFEQGGLGFAEYLVAGQEKGYEALLVASNDELKLVSALRPYFKFKDREGRRLAWQARLIWVEEGLPSSSDLNALLASVPADERSRFLENLEVDETGQLGGELTSGQNVAVDPALAPQQNVPAILVLTLSHRVMTEVETD